MIPPNIRDMTRRHFFKQSGFGIGGLALSALLDETLFARQGPGPVASRAPHFAPKAKHIIYLFMAGAPTQLDLFDNKPALQQHNGEEIPAEFIPKGERFAFINSPASSSCSRARTHPTAASRAGAADFCPRSIRASSSDRKGIRYCSCRTRKVSGARRGANRSIS